MLRICQWLAVDKFVLGKPAAKIYDISDIVVCVVYYFISIYNISVKRLNL